MNISQFTNLPVEQKLDVLNRIFNEEETPNNGMPPGFEDIFRGKNI